LNHSVKPVIRSLNCLRKLYKEANRAFLIALQVAESRLLTAQHSRNSNTLGETRRKTTGTRVDDIGVARRHGRWREWRAWTWSRLVVVCRILGGTSTDGIAGEGEFALTLEEVWCLAVFGIWQQKLEGAGLVPGGGGKDEVEDGAEVAGSDEGNRGRPKLVVREGLGHIDHQAWGDGTRKQGASRRALWFRFSECPFDKLRRKGRGDCRGGEGD